MRVALFKNFEKSLTVFSSYMNPAIFFLYFSSVNSNNEDVEFCTMTYM